MSCADGLPRLFYVSLQPWEPLKCLVEFNSILILLQAWAHLIYTLFTVSGLQVAIS